MTPYENARLVLHTTSAADPISRAARRAAEDVLRLIRELRECESKKP
jgi:hypothetical protein